MRTWVQPQEGWGLGYICPHITLTRVCWWPNCDGYSEMYAFGSLFECSSKTREKLFTQEQETGWTWNNICFINHWLNSDTWMYLLATSLRKQIRQSCVPTSGLTDHGSGSVVHLIHLLTKYHKQFILQSPNLQFHTSSHCILPFLKLGRNALVTYFQRWALMCCSNMLLSADLRWWSLLSNV